MGLVQGRGGEERSSSLYCDSGQGHSQSRRVFVRRAESQSIVRHRLAKLFQGHWRKLRIRIRKTVGDRESNSHPKDQHRDKAEGQGSADPIRGSAGCLPCFGGRVLIRSGSAFALGLGRVILRVKAEESPSRVGV